MADREHRTRLHRDVPTQSATIGPDLVVRTAPRTLPPPPPASDFDHDFRDQQDELLQQLTNHYAPYEGLDMLVSTFERTIDGTLKATFREGHRLQNVDESAVKPRVGLTFLPGADMPQVNALEELSMTQATPDQKDSAWRVTTVGALLSNITVHKDMSISFFDNTAAVVNATRKRLSSDGPFSDPNISPKSLALRKASDHVVTIDSSNVNIVNDLRLEKWDLEAVLVEVDQASLMDLISNYQRVITRGGPDLPTTETLQLLDLMIEDARRLCIRSPILFRMTTRRQIVASKNTRYGVDDGMMFKTLTTSAGIKNIIRVSSSYFNSLPQTTLPAHEKQKIQSEVRPRFLQMLVLLLSLLNDDDLMELSGFLQDTYGILAERQHLELLILKVLPLYSINSKIFLRALVTAFDGHLVNPSNHLEDQPVVWDIFMNRILQQGYLLPGTIDQLGCEDRSWVIKWSKEGFKDTAIFKNLQYSGQHRTINEIPPLSLNPQVASNAELTVILANRRNYIIASADLENIIRMNSGRYVVTEAMSGGRSFDLDINDVWVNQSLFRAITDINSMLGLVKSILPSRPKNEIVRRFDSLIRNGSMRRPGRRYDDTSLPEIKGCGRLTYSIAKLNGHFLALACKVDGRKIHTRELIALLNRDVNKINATIKAVELTIQAAFEGRKVDEHTGQTAHRLKNKMSEIWKLQEEAERRKNDIGQYDQRLPSEPVTKVLYQLGAANTQVSVFSEYNAWHQAAENVLFIDSERRLVSEVVWSNDTLIVSFHDVPMKYFASPLRQLEEHEKWEELNEGDSVLLVGHYMLVVEPSDKTFVPSGAEGGGRRVTIARSPGIEMSSGESMAIPMPQPPPLPVPRYGYDPIRGDPIPRQLRAGQGTRPYHYDSMADGHGQGSDRMHAAVQRPRVIRDTNMGNGYMRKPVPVQRPQGVPLEYVVNWLKVTGVEAVPGNRRRRNRLVEVPKVRSAIR